MRISLPAGRPLGGVAMIGLEWSGIPTKKSRKSIYDQTMSTLQLGRAQNMPCRRAVVHQYRQRTENKSKKTVIAFDNIERAAQPHPFL
ncbi:MAG TPA: hypothetical protein VGL86_03420 [Polyangia bacterium]|jgi:hypothetical protein